ncbi:unnamed protein product [Closterium sp. Naga37s-1]|nr:unnamed protein product [Closterium sp. Naga37s-1]
MAAMNVVLLIPLVLAFMPPHVAHASTPQPTQFEISMRKTLELPEELRRQHADRILEAARDAEREFESGGAGGRRGERVLVDTGVKLGLSAPPLSSGPSMATVNMSFYRWESVAPPPVIDWRRTVAITPIQTQYVVRIPLAPPHPSASHLMSASCHGLSNFPLTLLTSPAVLKLMMWAIANNGVGTNMSPQQVCDCATKQCCQGGWPEWAFSYVLFNGGVTSNANYPYLAYDSATCLLDTSMPSVAQITGWELVPAFNAMALMKAAYSSRGVLNIYNGVCSTEVNHAVVVVVGFNYTGPDLKGSYWIIKNSWYATWGDRGYMYLAMTPDVRGKCGILSLDAPFPLPRLPVWRKIVPGLLPIRVAAGALLVRQGRQVENQQSGRPLVVALLLHPFNHQHPQHYNYDHDSLTLALQFLSVAAGSTQQSRSAVKTHLQQQSCSGLLCLCRAKIRCDVQFFFPSPTPIPSLFPVSLFPDSMTSINCTGWYRVMQGDTCPSIWNAANLTMSMFLSINPGIQCQAPYLVVGQQVCINSPVLTTMQRNPNANYSIYTVRANDTLSTISSLFLPRCTLLSVTPAAIATQNFIVNPSAPLPIGMNLIIPCIGGFGMIDGGCALSLTVCGADFVSYPSYCHAAVNYALPIFQNSPCDRGTWKGHLEGAPVRGTWKGHLKGAPVGTPVGCMG